MATQKIDIDNFGEFASKNTNRLQKIEELVYNLENEFKLIDDNNLWAGKNADAFYEALNEFSDGSLSGNIRDDIDKISTYLTDALNNAIETDQEVSKKVEATKNE